LTVFYSFFVIQKSSFKPAHIYCASEVIVLFHEQKKLCAVKVPYNKILCEFWLFFLENVLIPANWYSFISTKSLFVQWFAKVNRFIFRKLKPLTNFSTKNYELFH